MCVESVYLFICGGTHVMKVYILCAHMHAEAWGKCQVYLSITFLLLLFWNKLFQWTWSSQIQIDCLASKLQGSCFLSSPIEGLEACILHLGFYLSIGSPNSGPYACRASASPATDISLGPCEIQSYIVWIGVIANSDHAESNLWPNTITIDKVLSCF